VHSDWGEWVYECRQCRHAAIYKLKNKVPEAYFKTNRNRADAYLHLLKTLDFNSVLEIGTPDDFYFLEQLHAFRPEIEKYGHDIFQKQEIPPYVHMYGPDEEDWFPVDLVYATHVMEHIPKLKRWLRRVDRTGRWVIIEVPLEPESKRLEYVRKKRSSMYHYHFFSAKSIKALVKRLGLKGYRMSTNTPNGVRGRILYRLPFEI